VANPLHLFGGPRDSNPCYRRERQCPRPLDDGTSEAERTLFNLKLTKKQRVNQELNKAFHHPPPPLPHQGGGEILGKGGVIYSLCSRMRGIILDEEEL